ncbi:hypothetical protein [Patiriisocius marinus]|uniref:hypothetical protein n=1 Tax=Patiriisocius marinus TaxID=1397112 RepID=UPI00232F4667|nr:hypothetical protein [Patiriisocius marinus]
MTKAILFLLLFPTLTFAQIGEYNNLHQNRKTYSVYVSKSGDTIKKGDSYIFGLPTNGNQYVWITQGNAPCFSHISGDTFQIKDFLAWSRNKNSSKKMYARCKGYGLVKIDIDFENALKSGEIELIE